MWYLMLNQKQQTGNLEYYYLSDAARKPFFFYNPSNLIIYVCNFGFKQYLQTQSCLFIKKIYVVNIITLLMCNLLIF